MKPFTYILLLLITTYSFFACGDDTSVSSQLMKAEELMEKETNQLQQIANVLWVNTQRVKTDGLLQGVLSKISI